MSNRRSPRRQVESVARLGTHGSVRYQHLLECGHSITRPRRESGFIRCIKCYQPPDVFENEGEIRACQVKLASALGISPEEVHVRVGATDGWTVLRGATVWLGAAEVLQLLR